MKSSFKARLVPLNKRNLQIFGDRKEFPAIDLSRVPRNLKAIMAYAKHKDKLTGATLTPTYIIKDYNERNNTAIWSLKR